MIHALSSVINSKAWTISLAMFALVICFFFGCMVLTPEQRAFRELSPEQQRAEMRRQPLDKQVDYYLVGQWQHPPFRGLADEIARQGRDALPVLMRRLSQENDEGSKANLMYVFEEMHRYYYDLSQEQEVINLLRNTTAKMKYKEFKERGEETLQVILTNKKADPHEVLDRMDKELYGN